MRSGVLSVLTAHESAGPGYLIGATFGWSGACSARAGRGLRERVDEGWIMRYDEFLAKIRERGEYSDRVESEKITSAVLGLLACRLTADGVENLSAQLPVGTATAMTPQPPET